MKVTNEGYDYDMVEIHERVLAGEDEWDVINEMADSMTDVYHYKLIEWLKEDSEAFNYCDDALAEYSPGTINELIMIAQCNRIRDKMVEEYKQYKKDVREAEEAEEEEEDDEEY